MSGNGTKYIVIKSYHQVLQKIQSFMNQQAFQQMFVRK